MGLLKFTLLAIDNLAWPAIALGYPLFASIRAVGTDSKYHMRKLVMYWTVFALLSLFEFAFVKIIQWIPYWSSVRFAVIYWLVIPEFEGACLVTPALLLKLQEVIDLYHKLKEERLYKTETISDAVEKYAKENGFEALEKLIALNKQHESQDCIDYQRGTKVIESEGENTAAISKEQEWTCDLCNFTTTNVSMLDAHLRWSNHISKVESLKATLLDDQDSGPSPSQQVQNMQPFSASSKFNHGYVEEKLIKESGFDLEKFIEAEVDITPPLEKAQQVWSCDLCKVKVMSEKTMIAHVLGKRHKCNGNRIKIKGGVPWCAICDAMLLSDVNAASHFKGKRHSANIEMMVKLKAIRS